MALDAVQKREVTVAVRLYDRGPMSRWLRRLKVGDEVDVSGPVNGECVSKRGFMMIFARSKHL